jgi:hypothetical protein
LFDDWELIEASFAEQYNIRLSQTEDMSWQEFSSLLHGISSETALGRMVSIRAEEDREILKKFTTDQKAERNRWRTREASKISEEDMEKTMADLEKMFASAFG